MDRGLGRRLLVELLGSAFLAAVVIGSGIATQRLSPGDVGLQPGELSGDRRWAVRDLPDVQPGLWRASEPGRSWDASFGGISWRDALAYTPAQVCGCIIGWGDARQRTAPSRCTATANLRRADPATESGASRALGIFAAAASLVALVANGRC